MKPCKELDAGKTSEEKKSICQICATRKRNGCNQSLFQPPQATYIPEEVKPTRYSSQPQLRRDEQPVSTRVMETRGTSRVFADLGERLKSRWPNSTLPLPSFTRPKPKENS